MSPDCTIQLVSVCGISALIQHVDLVTTLLRGGSRSTSLIPGFCVHSRRRFNTICWELNLISGFFCFSLVKCLGGWNQ